MKANKKAILTTATVLGAAALVAGGTIAYFTDKDEKTNTFTVGNVDIQLYESQLHRQNSGRMGNFPGLPSDPNYCDWNAVVATTAGDSSLISGSYEKAAYCTPNMGTSVGDATGITAVENEHTAANRTWGFTDQQIKDDAETYKAAATATYDGGYFTQVASSIVPGQWIRKFSYVENKSTSSDAYVLIRYLVPTAINDKVTINMPSTPFLEDTDATTDGVQPYFVVVEKGANGYEEVTMTKNELKAYKGYTDETGNYKVYAAVTRVALNPGEMTFWSPVNTIKLNNNTQNTDPAETDTYVVSGAIYDIKVDAQAVQAKTFGNAIEAINAANLD